MKSIVSSGIRETSSDARQCVMEHKDELWGMIRSLSPYFLVLGLLVSLVGYMGSLGLQEQIVSLPKSENGRPLMNDAFFAILRQSYADPMSILGYGLQVMLVYVSAILGINWYRFVLSTSENFVPVNMFRPRKSELQYVGILALVNLLPILGGYIFSYGNVFATFFAAAFIIISWVLCIRMGFIFPALAMNHEAGFSMIYKLNKGYFQKILFSMIRALLRMAGLYIVYILLTSLALSALGLKDDLWDGSIDFASVLAGFIINIPLYLYFAPMMMVLSITVLANFYAHALQNAGARG